MHGVLEGHSFSKTGYMENTDPTRFIYVAKVQQNE